MALSASFRKARSARVGLQRSALFSSCPVKSAQLDRNLSRLFSDSTTTYCLPFEQLTRCIVPPLSTLAIGLSEITTSQLCPAWLIKSCDARSASVMVETRMDGLSELTLKVAELGLGMVMSVPDSRVRFSELPKKEFCPGQMHSRAKARPSATDPIPRIRRLCTHRAISSLAGVCNGWKADTTAALAGRQRDPSPRQTALKSTVDRDGRGYSAARKRLSQNPYYGFQPQEIVRCVQPSPFWRPPP